MDSVMFRHKEGEYTLPEGGYLGQLTSECPEKTHY